MSAPDLANSKPARPSRYRLRTFNPGVAGSSPVAGTAVCQVTHIPPERDGSGHRTPPVVPKGR